MNAIARLVFIGGLAGGGVAALLIGLQGPDGVSGATTDAVADTADFDALIELAFADYDTNDALADSAPQQQVVNGWIARDMLRIIAEQNDASADTLDALVRLEAASPRDERPAHLLVVLTLVMSWIGAWAAVAWRPRPDTAATSLDRPRSGTPPGLDATDERPPTALSQGTPNGADTPR